MLENNRNEDLKHSENSYTSNESNDNDRSINANDVRQKSDTSNTTDKTNNTVKLSRIDILKNQKAELELKILAEEKKHKEKLVADRKAEDEKRVKNFKNKFTSNSKVLENQVITKILVDSDIEPVELDKAICALYIKLGGEVMRTALKGTYARTKNTELKEYIENYKIDGVE